MVEDIEELSAKLNRELLRDLRDLRVLRGANSFSINPEEPLFLKEKLLLQRHETQDD